jgi:tetratricopeptide (TPR) repeat protein
MSDPHCHLMSVFIAVRGMGSVAERAEYLDRTCAGNPAVRAEVEALLQADAEAGAFLEPPEHLQPTAALDESSAPAAFGAPEPGAGEVVAGRYRLVESIGTGGMGAVWRAEQTEPVRREVALKLIKRGMDSAQVVARFAVERQALALMDHPNIAKVHDGGTAADGRPFFVMELVRGVPITTYCDDHRMALRDRLELFVSVCEAVQHAHQKGVIHRDLKPSNVLVGETDGKAVAKVIDFGIAKATGTPLTDRTLFTGLGGVVGTPEYMSPEQAELNNRDIDTRSDVYSLGVLLYELLTGTTPLETRRVKEAGLLEALRVIREEDTPRPSTRLTTTVDLPSIASRRNLEPQQLSRLVKGELDWIVMTALEKDRARRYETASGLARDLQRYLADEPVQACPPSAGYRVRKFVRRNKVPVAAAGGLLLMMVLAMVGLIASNVLIGQARQDALQARDKANERRDLALRAVEDMWVGVAEKWMRDQPGLEQTQREFVQKALEFYERLAGEEAGNTDVQAAVATSYFRIAVIHDRLGALEKGAAAYQRAAELFGRLAAQSPDNPEYRYWRARSLAEHGELCDRQGRGAEAEALSRQALGLFEQAAADFPGDTRIRAGLADCCLVLGSVNYNPGPRLGYIFSPEWAPEMRWRECLRLLPRALELYPKVIAEKPGTSEHRWRYHRAQKILAQMPNLPWAERSRLTQESLAGFEALIAEFPREHRPLVELSEALQLQGFLLQIAGRLKEEEAAYRKALAIADTLIADYKTVPYYSKLQASARYRLGMLLARTNRVSDGDILLSQAAEALGAVPPGIVPPYEPTHEAARCYDQLGLIRAHAGRFEEAGQQFRKALALDLVVARDYPSSTTINFVFRDCRLILFVGTQIGRVEEAIQAYRDVVAFWKQIADTRTGDPTILRFYAMSVNELGVALRNLGRLEEADRAYVECQAIHARADEKAPLDPGAEGSWAFTQVNRACLQLLMGSPVRAAESFRQCVEWHRRRLATASPASAAHQYALAMALWDLGDRLEWLDQPVDQFVAAYTESIAILDGLTADEPGRVEYLMDLAEIRMELAFIQQRARRFKEAGQLADEAVAIRRKVAGSGELDDQADLCQTLSEQALLRHLMGQPAEAAAVRDDAATLLRRLSTAGPAPASALESLAKASANCGRLFELAGRMPAAESAYVQAIELRKRRLQEVSSESLVNIQAHLAWAESHADLGRFYWRQRRREQVVSRFAAARDAYEQVNASFPMWEQVMAPVAKFLTTAPVESVRDSGWAAEFAKQTGFLNIGLRGPSEAALGMARYRQGKYREAAESLERASRRHNGFDPPENLFFRAMARWKLGEEEAARRDYETAARLTSLAIHRWSELEQLRDEAATVLGVK